MKDLGVSEEKNSKFSWGCAPNPIGGAVINSSLKQGLISTTRIHSGQEVTASPIDNSKEYGVSTLNSEVLAANSQNHPKTRKSPPSPRGRGRTRPDHVRVMSSFLSPFSLACSSIKGEWVFGIATYQFNGVWRGDRLHVP